MIKKLFNSEGRVDFQGQHYQLKEASFCPRQGGSKPIPIMIGGKGEKRTLNTLAKYGDIMNVQAGPAEISHLSKVLERHCEAIGRDPNEIKKTMHGPIKLVREKEVAQSSPNVKEWSLIGPPQLVIDRIGAFLDVGVTEFIPYIRPQKPEIYQELDEEIFSAFD